MISKKEQRLMLAIKNLVAAIKENAQLSMEIDHPRWAKDNLRDIVIGLDVALIALNEMEELSELDSISTAKTTFQRQNLFRLLDASE